jgi:DNA repair protein RecN (Recombination protein N)
VARAAAALGAEGAEPAVADALRRLEAAADRADGRLDAAVAAAARALDALAEAGQAAERALADLRFDPGALERTEERLFGLRALARKHGVQPDELAALGERLRARLEALDGAGRSSAALEAAVRQAEAAYAERSAALSSSRRDAAARLDAAMAAELAPLKLERARFATEVGAGEPGPDGVDTVTFTVAPDGVAAGPLNRIASGGELSRFLLALKVCLRARADELTMIFDEIDRGVGGATADAVGRRLAALAQGSQVLVVTHAPQVAARAAHHWRVAKVVDAEGAVSRVGELDAAQRIDELARMLAGDRVTDAARQAARALVSSPAGAPGRRDAGAG